MTAVGETIGFDDFLQVAIRVGTVIKAEPYPEARRPAYKVWVDFGAEIGVKKTSAQATAHYTLDDLIVLGSSASPFSDALAGMTM